MSFVKIFPPAADRYWFFQLAAILLVLSMLSPAQVNAQESLQIAPPPTDHPLYGRAKALIERLTECSRAHAVAASAFKQAEARIYLVDSQKRDDMTRYKAARDSAGSCASRAERELLQDALPELERRCSEQGKTNCATWARDQRVWRIELTQTQDAIQACYSGDDRAGIQTRIDSVSGSSYTAQGSRTIRQQVDDIQILKEQYFYIAAKERACATPYSAKAVALRDGIEGRDRAAEGRAARLANIKSLYGLLQETLGSPSGPAMDSDLPRRVAALTAVVKMNATQAFADYPTHGPAIQALVETGEGLFPPDVEWMKEQTLRSEKVNAERRRDAAQVEYSRRRTSGSRLELDIAEGNLRSVTQALADLEQRRNSRWNASRTRLELVAELRDIER